MIGLGKFRYVYAGRATGILHISVLNSYTKRYIAQREHAKIGRLARTIYGNGVIVISRYRNIKVYRCAIKNGQCNLTINSGRKIYAAAAFYPYLIKMQAEAFQICSNIGNLNDVNRVLATGIYAYCKIERLTESW